jgi:hypothetical protein
MDKRHLIVPVNFKLSFIFSTLKTPDLKDLKILLRVGHGEIDCDPG